MTKKYRGTYLDFFLYMMSLPPDILVGDGGRESYQKKTGLPSGPQQILDACSQGYRDFSVKATSLVSLA